jgi:putative membrane protein
MAHILPTISTSCIAVSAVLVGIGWRKIATGKQETHKKFMLAGALFALAFFVIYVSKTLFVGNTQFGGPERLEPVYRAFLLFHIVLATAAGAFGLSTITLAFRQNFAKHKKLGPITASIWFAAAVTGLSLYTLLYILYPGGETGALLDAIFG